MNYSLPRCFKTHSHIQFYEDVLGYCTDYFTLTLLTNETTCLDRGEEVVLYKSSDRQSDREESITL